jgi:heme-degrading monooxygenase HmoA
MGERSGPGRRSGGMARRDCALASGMIARTWRGWTRPEDSDAFLDYVERTGGRAARETPGNRGYYILRREDGDRTEFVTMSLWDSLDAIRAFAGDNLDEAVFYEDHDRFLVDRERFVTHYEIAGP